MILNEFFNSNQTESLADDFMKMAREKGYNPTLRTGPQPTKPTKPAGAAPADSGAIDRSAVQAELDQLQKQFDPNYQYSDDYTFWSKQNRIAQRMSVLKKLLAKGVAETTGDKPFDKMMTTIKQGTNKQKTADRKEQQKQTQQQARDAFGNMFGGGNPADKLKIREQGVAEGHADQQRKIFKKNGEPVGEVGIDRESSPGVGQWYMKCYAYDIDNSGYDSYEEAVAELKHCLRQGMAEGKEEKIAQLKKDHATAVHWSKNETSPQKREAARRKAETIKAHLEKQYKQGVAEVFANPGSGSTGTARGAKRIATTVRKALAKHPETPEQIAARKDFEARIDARRAEKREQGVAEADELRARGGLAAVNKKPRIGQTDMRNIPVGNHPDARINKFTDKDRAEHPSRLKAKIKSTLGKHTRPNLPEQGVAEAVTPASVSKVLRLIQRHHSDWFDTYGMGEVEDAVVDMAEMGQFRGTSAAVALKLVGDELESMYGQQGVAEVKAVKGSFPFDVDHMHGPRGINLSWADTRDLLQKPFEHYGNYKEWYRDVNRVNSELLDDNAEFSTMSGGKIISINGKDFAFWSNRNGNGSIDIGIAKKHSGQGVAEAKAKTQKKEVVGFRSESEFKTWKQYAQKEGYEIREAGNLPGSYAAFDDNGKRVGYFYNEFDLPNGYYYVGELITSVEQGVAEGLAQDEAEEDSGWRAEFVNEINYNTFEVKLTNTRSKESANFIVRPVDMVSYGPTLSIETMDVHDLQTGQTESWTNDDPAPDGPIAYAISGLFYDDKQLQKKLQNIIDTHDTKGQDMMPGLEKRRSIGQEVDADAYIDSQEKTQAAMAKMKKGVAEKLGDNRPKLGSKRDAGKSVRKWRKTRGLDETGVAEGAPIVVALAPIDVRNPEKAPQPYRNQGDIVPPSQPPSTEKRGVKGRPGQRPMPNVAEGYDNPWGDQGNFAGDTPVNLGGETVNKLQVGDIVTYFGQKARIEAMSKTGNTSRITIANKMGGITQDVLTRDLKRTGVAEAKPEDSKIGGRYTPNEFDSKLARIKARHQATPANTADLAARLQAAYKKQTPVAESRQKRKSLLKQILKG